MTALDDFEGEFERIKKEQQKENLVHSTDKQKRPTKKEAVNSQHISLEPPSTLEKALGELERAIGGRDHLVSSLQLIPEMSAEQTTVLYQLADPANARRSLAWICGNAGITVGRLLELFTKGDFAQAYVKAIRKVYRMMPDVAEDAMNRAVGKFKTCIVCKGAGKLRVKIPVLGEDEEPVNPPQWERVWQTCLHCEGIGRVEVEPDIERQKVALQMAGLLKSGGGVTIQQNQNTMNVGPVTLVKSTPDFRTATDKLLYPGRDRHQLPQSTESMGLTPATPIEAEVVEAQSDVFDKDNQL